VLLIGLQDELVVQLDQLDAAGLLPAEDDVAVLAKGDRSGDILELKDSLHGLDSFRELGVVLGTWLRKLEDVDPG
jgi:hypothetical protein